MDSNYAAILERIAKLLAMAKDASSPHEAAIAGERARKLMDQYQISLQDVAVGQRPKDPMTGKNVTKAYKYFPEWMQWMSVYVADSNDCLARKQGAPGGLQYIAFLGRESDVALAAQMYEYLCGAIERLCKADQKALRESGAITTNYNAKIGDAFKRGAARIIGARLAQLQKEREAANYSGGTSLVVRKMTEVVEHFGEARYKNKTDNRSLDWDQASAMHRGKEAGAKVSLSNQISGDSTEQTKIA